MILDSGASEVIVANGISTGGETVKVKTAGGKCWGERVVGDTPFGPMPAIKIKDSPNLFPLHKVIELGMSFRWSPGKAPTILLDDGQVIKLDLDGNIPMLPKELPQAFASKVRWTDPSNVKELVTTDEEKTSDENSVYIHRAVGHLPKDPSSHVR